MKAVNFEYKSTKTKIVEVNVPLPSTDEIVVKVSYAALDTALDPVINKTFLGGLVHKFTNPLFCGWHFSGIIAKLGEDVSNSDFQIGDKVFGHLPYTKDNSQGSLAEYIAIKADACSLIPEGVESDIAAASTTEVSTALQGLRDKGGLEENKQSPQSVLINGAGGGVGIAAVQIAKRMGANITAICSTKDVQKVQELGANIVIDRKKVSNVFSGLKKNQFDIIFDTPYVLPALKTLTYLKPKGKLVLTGMKVQHLIGMISATVSRKDITMVLVESRRDDLELIGKWLADGFQIDIDSTFDIKDIEDAAARNRDKSKKGRVVVKVENGWS